MRFSMYLVLALASLSLTAMAQTRQKPTKVKPSHQEGTRKGSRVAAPPKETKSQNSASQQLKRVESESAKSSSSKRTQQQKGQKSGFAKTPHEKPAPPIRVASAKSGQSSLTNRGSNPYKGRLRQKGANHHR